MTKCILLNVLLVYSLTKVVARNMSIIVACASVQPYRQISRCILTNKRGPETAHRERCLPCQLLPEPDGGVQTIALWTCTPVSIHQSKLDRQDLEISLHNSNYASWCTSLEITSPELKSVKWPTWWRVSLEFKLRTPNLADQVQAPIESLYLLAMFIDWAPCT